MDPTAGVTAGPDPRPGRVGDRLLALVAVGACVVERLVAVPGSGAATRDGAAVLLPAVLLAGVVGGALLWRRRAPLAAYLVGTAGLAAESLLVQPSGVSPYANLVGLASLAWWGTPRRALWGPPVALAGIAAWFARDPAPSVVPVTVGAVWLLCWAFAYQQARARDGAVRQREHRQGEAVREERERIARELHDVVGHALSLMLVQIGAARTVLHEQPDTTRDLLRTAEKVGAETMVELDRVLGLLRTDTDAPRATGTATQTDLGGTRPGLADLDRLVDRLGEAGLQVRLERDPGLEHLRPSTSLAVYRIAQESLTNALRHGHAVGARVVLGRHGDHLRLEVVDDGTGPPPGWVPGRGLIGVRERVQVLEGTVEHGPAPGGGFRVAVQLPLEPGA